MVSLENICVDTLCSLKVLSDKCHTWTIVTRAHAPRQVALWVCGAVGYPEFADAFEEHGEIRAVQNPAGLFICAVKYQLVLNCSKFHADVGGGLAAVLSAEDLELDLGIGAWSVRMAILLAIKQMVENSKRFGTASIGFDGRAVAIGLGRIVALCYRTSTLYHIH
jgi:hypothetical protein